jgi:predicted regulator of Ras-like GTPase activity (Roadblock/LC7/MglB family)
MTAHNTAHNDIFAGAEKVEILGKLPQMLWAYIEGVSWLLEELGANPAGKSPRVQQVQTMLDVLISAAAHLGNEELKSRLANHRELIRGLAEGKISGNTVVQPIQAELPRFRAMAGPRPVESITNGLLDQHFFEKEMQKVERIKTGRSLDIVVTVELIDQIRDYLTKEVMTEGISSILVIDDSGSLIVQAGEKVDMDVVSLAAVAAANFASTEKIARLIGERDFVLLFYKGHNESFHFTRIANEYIIVTIFDNSLSLGLLRLRIAKACQALQKKLPKKQG